MGWNARALLAGMLLAASAPLLAQAQEPDDNWEGLVRVQSQAMEFVYLAPGADFRPYTKVMLDPSEMAMVKDWSSAFDHDRGVTSFQSQATDREVVRALERARKRFDRFFAGAFAGSGFTTVRSRGADVVRVRVGVFDIDLQTPDSMRATRNERLYLSENAGQATLVVEVRDSVSNALLGRAIDRGVAGDTGPSRRDFGSHKVDYDRLFRQWASASAEGMAELRNLSPVDVNGERLAR
jgi:hypothetical protein